MYEEITIDSLGATEKNVGLTIPEGKRLNIP